MTAPALERRTWDRVQGRVGVLLGLVPLVWALSVVAGGVATRTYCATAVCHPDASTDLVRWQESTYAALTGPLQSVWLLYVSVLLLGIVASFLAFVAGGLLAAGSRAVVAGRPAVLWVVLSAGAAAVVLVAAMALFGAEFTWVNNALE